MEYVRNKLHLLVWEEIFNQNFYCLPVKNQVGFRPIGINIMFSDHRLNEDSADKFNFVVVVCKHSPKLVKDQCSWYCKSCLGWIDCKAAIQGKYRYASIRLIDWCAAFRGSVIRLYFLTSISGLTSLQALKTFCYILKDFFFFSILWLVHSIFWVLWLFRIGEALLYSGCQRFLFLVNANTREKASRWKHPRMLCLST